MQREKTSRSIAPKREQNPENAVTKSQTECGKKQ